MSTHKYILLPYSEYMRQQSMKPKPSQSERFTTELKSVINTPGIDDNAIIDQLTNIMTDYVNSMKSSTLSTQASDKVSDVGAEGTTKSAVNTSRHDEGEENGRQPNTSVESHFQNTPSTSKEHNNKNETLWNKDIYPDIIETSDKNSKLNEKVERKGSQNESKTKAKHSEASNNDSPSKLRRSERKPKPVARLRNNYITLD